MAKKLTLEDLDPQTRAFVQVMTDIVFDFSFKHGPVKDKTHCEVCRQISEKE